MALKEKGNGDVVIKELELHCSNGGKFKIGDTVSYTRKVSGDSYRSGKDSYSTYKDIECLGVIKFGLFENNYCVYVETDKENTHLHYFFGKGEYRTVNMSERFDIKKEYFLVDSDMK